MYESYSDRPLPASNVVDMITRQMLKHRGASLRSFHSNLFKVF